MSFLVLTADAVSIIALVYVIVLSTRTIRMLEGRLTRRQARRLADARAARARSERSAVVPL